MLPYLLLFAVPSYLALVYSAGNMQALSQGRSLRSDLLWWVFGLALFLMIGWRFEVGGDWTTYLEYIQRARYYTLSDVLGFADPGYWFLNWQSVRLGWGILGVNAVSGFVFAIALVFFCRNLPRPWLAASIAVPYLVIVVGMGYSRQALALSFAMIGLTFLMRGRLTFFVLSVMFATVFHTTVLLLLPVMMLSLTRNRWLNFALVLLVAIIGYFLLIEESVDQFYVRYVESEMQSDGALIRLGMNAIAAALFLMFYKRMRISERARALWFWPAVISLGFLALYFLTPYSTALDRMALYFLPMQVAALSSLPSVVSPKKPGTVLLITAAIIALYAAALLVWLLFATHAEYWVPYRSFLLM